jgi:hypothetical protein
MKAFFVIAAFLVSASAFASGGRVSYQWSNNHNCKLMINGEYSNQNVADSFCQGARGEDMVSYEWSNNHNCKLMINGQYANQNVSDYFCTARHDRNDDRRRDDGSAIQSYQWSNQHNCKLLENGQYKKLVSNQWCAGAYGEDVVNYYWTIFGNCKKYVNNVFSGEYASTYYCSTRN